MKLLAVDDSRTARLIVARAGDVLGFELVEAANGRQGLEVARKERPDLILLDWNMPEMDGLQMLQALKADPDLASIPVTMVTTEAERHKVVEAIKTGARNYLTKPYTQEQLVAKILEALGMGM